MILDYLLFRTNKTKKYDGTNFNFHVRHIAEELNINKNTVCRALKGLPFLNKSGARFNMKITLDYEACLKWAEAKLVPKQGALVPPEVQTCTSTGTSTVPAEVRTSNQKQVDLKSNSTSKDRYIVSPNGEGGDLVSSGLPKGFSEQLLNSMKRAKLLLSFDYEIRTLCRIIKPSIICIMVVHDLGISSVSTTLGKLF